MLCHLFTIACFLGFSQSFHFRGNLIHKHAAKGINRLKQGDENIPTSALKDLLQKGDYTYNYTMLPTIAYSEGLHFADLPTTKWILLALNQARLIFRNSVILGFIEKVDESLGTKFAALIGGLVPLHEDEEESDLKTKPTTIEDYKHIFETLPLPLSEKYVDYGDPRYAEFFAYTQVAGFNPLVLEKIQSIPKKFPMTDEIFKKVDGFKEDSLQNAIKEDRLFFVDYKDLIHLQPGTTFVSGTTEKFVYAPMGLFAIEKGTGTLKVVAIQGGQDPKNNPITTADSANWSKMLLVMNAACANHHELISHLGRTHLLLEPFIVETSNLPTVNRAPHPIKALLLPHLEGTALINWGAVKFLVNPGGIIDQLLMGTIDSSLQLSAKKVHEPGFNKLMLPTFLDDKGVSKEKAPLLDYPFRDDGMRIWGATKEWVKNYIDIFYKTNEDVKSDIYVQNWGQNLASDNGGLVKGFGEDSMTGKITTKDYLVDALTMVIFTGSTMHAAVNFPQLNYMSYTPTAPLAGEEPVDSKENYMKFLPSIPAAKTALTTLQLLGGVYYTSLGQYSKRQFNHLKGDEKKKLDSSLLLFQDTLKAIEADIKLKNDDGLRNKFIPYETLLPTKIPQSINI